jgi:hypothetical protein
MRQFPVFEIQGGFLIRGRSNWSGGCAVLVALVAMCLSGCGSSEGYSLVPVSGTITLDGQPLAGASISFQRAGGDATVGPGSGGVTDASGKYELKTAEADSRSGAVVGMHVVRITGVQDQRAADDDTARPMAKDPVPPRYRDPGLTFEVPADGTDQANFELTSR